VQKTNLETLLVISGRAGKAVKNDLPPKKIWKSKNRLESHTNDVGMCYFYITLLYINSSKHIRCEIHVYDTHIYETHVYETHMYRSHTLCILL